MEALFAFVSPTGKVLMDLGMSFGAALAIVAAGSVLVVGAVYTLARR